MLIALDYDGTYTVDPGLWDLFIKECTVRGHQVICATMRRESEPIELPCRVIYTARAAKSAFLERLGLKPDVWIDDAPWYLMVNGE